MVVLPWAEQLKEKVATIEASKKKTAVIVMDF